MPSSLQILELIWFQVIDLVKVKDVWHTISWRKLVKKYTSNQNNLFVLLQVFFKVFRKVVDNCKNGAISTLGLRTTNRW